jgi:oxygen-independent coproporphyrinogen-3 oxidase
MLTKAGYEHYEISNFAKPGFRAKHNSVYWQGGEYLAFGPGASGFCDGVRYHIPPDTAEFCAQSGRVSPVEDEIVDEVESRTEAIFLGLRLSDGISPLLIPQEKFPFVQKLCSMGYGILTEDRFALTAEGFLISDYVIRELLPER